MCVCLEAGSFEYTKKVLLGLEEEYAICIFILVIRLVTEYMTVGCRALEEISRLDGNPVLSALFESLRTVYVEQ